MLLEVLAVVGFAAVPASYLRAVARSVAPSFPPAMRINPELFNCTATWRARAEVTVPVVIAVVLVNEFVVGS